MKAHAPLSPQFSQAATSSSHLPRAFSCSAKRHVLDFKLFINACSLHLTLSPSANWAGAIVFLLITIVGVVGIATCEDPSSSSSSAAAAAADDDSLSLVEDGSHVSSVSSAPPSPPSYMGLSPRVAGTLMCAVSFNDCIMSSACFDIKSIGNRSSVLS